MAAVAHEVVLGLLDSRERDAVLGWLEGHGQRCLPVECAAHLLVRRKVALFGAVGNLAHNAAGRCHIADAVDEDELALRAMMVERVEHDWFRHSDLAERDLILLEARRLDVLARVDVDAVVDLRQDAGNLLGAEEDHEVLADGNRHIIHPEDLSLEVCGLADMAALLEHAAARDVDLAVELDRDRLPLESRLSFMVGHEDLLDLGLLAARL